MWARTMQHSGGHERVSCDHLHPFTLALGQARAVVGDTRAKDSAFAELRAEIARRRDRLLLARAVGREEADLPTTRGLDLGHLERASGHEAKLATLLERPPKRAKTDPRGKSANSPTVRRPSSRSSSWTFGSTGTTSSGSAARNARPSSTERTSPGGVRSARTRATNGVGAIPADARAPTRVQRANTFRATRAGAPRRSSVPARSQANAPGSSTPTRGRAAWSVASNRPCSSGASVTTIESVTGSLIRRPSRDRRASQGRRARRRAT